MSKLIRVLIVIVLFAGACSDDSESVDPALPAVGAEDASVEIGARDHIRIATHNWASQLVGAEIVATLLRNAGYEVELVPADTDAVFQQMCDGEIDVAPEVWEHPFGLAFEAQVDAECVVDLVTHTATTREDWWYPVYVETACPGLPSWEALNDCAALFASEASPGRGRVLTGPLDWLKGDEQRIDALALNFDVVHLESGAALWAELDSAIAAQRPVVVFNWTPNFVEFIHEGRFVEFPEFEPECRTDPAWGDNASLTHDCGNPVDGYLKLGVSQQFVDDWPVAADLLRRVEFSTPMLAGMAALVEVGDLQPAEAAQAWMDANPAIIALWVGTG